MMNVWIANDKKLGNEVGTIAYSSSVYNPSTDQDISFHVVHILKKDK